MEQLKKIILKRIHNTSYDQKYNRKFSNNLIVNNIKKLFFTDWKNI